MRDSGEWWRRGPDPNRKKKDFLWDCAFLVLVAWCVCAAASAILEKNM